MKLQRMLSIIAATTLASTLGACSSLSVASTQAATASSSPTATAAEPSESPESPSKETSSSEPSETESKQPSDDNSDEPSTDSSSEPSTTTSSKRFQGTTGVRVPDMSVPKALSAAQSIADKLKSATTADEAKAAINASFCTWKTGTRDNLGTFYQCRTSDGLQPITLFVFDEPNFAQATKDASRPDSPLTWAYTERFVVAAMAKVFVQLESAQGSAKA